MNDRVLGAGLLAGGVLALVIFILLLFFGGPGLTFVAWEPTGWWWLAVTIVNLVLVGAVAFIIIWIGWTLATTPGPAPIETPSTSTTTSPPSEATNTSTSSEAGGEKKE